MKLTDIEFQRLLELEKNFDENKVDLPGQGESKTFNLINREYGERFLLDINRSGKLELRKFTLQDRYQKTKLPLVRVDIDSPTHRNPDGKKLSRNHIHIYSKRNK